MSDSGIIAIRNGNYLQGYMLYIKHAHLVVLVKQWPIDSHIFWQTGCNLPNSPNFLLPKSLLQCSPSMESHLIHSCLIMDTGVSYDNKIHVKASDFLQINTNGLYNYLFQKIVVMLEWSYLLNKTF